MVQRVVSAAAVVLVLVACSEGSTPDGGLDAGDASQPGDGGGDARTADGGRDAGVHDGGIHDAGERDASEAPDASDAMVAAPREAASVFFVGHSLVNFDMPAMLAELAGAAGAEHRYGSQIGIGAPLWWNWTYPETADGDDAVVELPTGRYDVLVLTELIPIREHVMYSNTVEYAGRFADLALGGNPSTQIYVYETWYDVTDPEWRANIDADRAIWEQVADELDARTPGLPVLMVPAGTAMGRLVDRMEAGGVDGLDSRADLFVDEIHLNDIGNYFVALVQLATIYRQSPVGLPAATHDRFGAAFDPPSPAAARVMQEIAWEVVSRDPRAGVAPR